MCFVWISEQTAIISLYSVEWLGFITGTESVYCAVRTWVFTYLICKFNEIITVTVTNQWTEDYCSRAFKKKSCLHLQACSATHLPRRWIIFIFILDYIYECRIFLNRSETPGKFWNVMLEKNGEDQSDRSREKWRSVTWSQWIEEYHTWNNKTEG